MEEHRAALIACKEATTDLHHKARKRGRVKRKREMGGGEDGGRAEVNDKNERKDEDDRMRRRR
jgi:hypothetical protein